MARPTKRTPATETAITDALRGGATRKDAAAAAGINFDTYLEWRKRFSDFSDQCTRAEGEAALRCTDRIRQEIEKDDGDWRAALEWLKRRRRDEWGDTLKVAPFAAMSDDELFDFLARTRPPGNGL